MVTRDNYHADTTHVSKSGLDKINRSPAHYWHHYLNPDKEDEDTQALKIGRAFHTIVTEEHRFYREFIVTPNGIDRRTKDGKLAWSRFLEAAEGRTLLKDEEWEQLIAMRNAVMEHPICWHIFNGEGYAEEVFTGTCQDTGVPVKCRTDWRTHDDIVFDLKTTDDARQDSFARSVRKYRYQVQDAFYRDVFTASTGRYLRGFIFIAVEKTPPYNVKLYELDEDAQHDGRVQYIDNLITFRDCKTANKWPGYETNISKISI